MLKLEYSPAAYAVMVMGLAKSPQHILADMTEENMHLLHMAVGVMGEVVELIAGLNDVEIENLDVQLRDAYFKYAHMRYPRMR